jgi:hypothetical protein
MFKRNKRRLDNMSISTIFHTSTTQLSTANQEIIQSNKPNGYNGTFIPNYFNFYNLEDCHVLLNNNLIPQNIPAGGFEYGATYQLQTLKVVESGIHYNFSGTIPNAPIAISQAKGSGIHAIGLMAQPCEITLNNGDTSQINVTAVRIPPYANSTMPQGTVYVSTNTNVATVNSTGLVSYVKTGYCKIYASNNGLYDIVEVTCN